MNFIDYLTFGNLSQRKRKYSRETQLTCLPKYQPLSDFSLYRRTRRHSEIQYEHVKAFNICNNNGIYLYTIEKYSRADVVVSSCSLRGKTGKVFNRRLLAQLGERWSADWEVAGSTHGRTKRVSNTFFGMQDFPYLRLGIRDFKAKSERYSGLKVCARGGMPKVTLGITGLPEILGRDYGIEKPYWGPSTNTQGRK